MLIALALLFGLLAFAGVLLYLGRGWLKLQERAAADAEDTPPARESTALPKPEEVLRFIRSVGTVNQMVVEAWREERKREGWSEEEIQQYLDERPALFVA